MTEQKHPRGLSDRLLTSGLWKVFGLDLLLLVAVACLGVMVYRLRPDLVWGYAGVILLAVWWTLGKAKAEAEAKKGS